MLRPLIYSRVAGEHFNPKRDSFSNSFAGMQNGFVEEKLWSPPDRLWITNKEAENQFV